LEQLLRDGGVAGGGRGGLLLLRVGAALGLDLRVGPDWGEGLLGFGQGCEALLVVLVPEEELQVLG
jgi:hypothetical protein